MRMRSHSFDALFVFLLLAVVGLLVIVPSCNRAPDLEMTQKFQEAQERFNRATIEADFLEAAGLYEQILDKGVACGALYYNLGNAYMQADERGRAIAAYRQAKQYRPRDPFLEANLNYALGSEWTGQQKNRLVDHILFWKDWLSYPEKMRISLAVAGLTLLLAIVTRITRNRKLWKRSNLLALVVALIALISLGYDYYRFEYLTHGVVVKAEVVARKGNSETYEPSFNEALSEGAEFLVKDRDARQAWLLIQLQEGPEQEGWIPADDAVIY